MSRLPRPGPLRRSGTSLVRRAEIALYLLGMLGVGLFLAEQCGAYVFQRVEGTRLDRVLRGNGTGAPRETERSSVRAAPGTVLGKIAIPSAGLSAVVVEGCGAAQLSHAVGRIPGTARFGESGTIGLAGHRDGLFFPLRKVSIGDSVVVRTTGSTLTYVVDWMGVVPPRDTGVLGGGGTPGLALVTCYPFRFIGPAPLRFVVRARRVSPA